MKCLPHGPRANLAPFHLAKIIQMPGLIVFLYENMSFRQVFMDGRELPRDPNPSWMGYSVGRWERDTLVIETSGFTDRSWIDFAGHPHTEALRITERLRRTAFGRIDIDTTFLDPDVYARPWTIATRGDLVPDTDLLEYVCDNEKSSAHMIGRASDGVDPGAVKKLPPEVLARYTGVYETRFPESTDLIRSLEVTSKDGDLYIDGLRRLAPLDESTFVVISGQGVRMTFVRGSGDSFDELRIERLGGCGGSSGVATSFICGAAPAELRATRKSGSQ